MDNRAPYRAGFSLWITGVFILLTGPRMLSHAMWRDEWQAWLLAEGSDSLFQLWFTTLRQECYPALWHSLLWLLNMAGLGAWAMQALHLVIATGTVYLVSRYAPWPRWWRGLFCFGYFPFYEYAVISRGYALGFFLLFAACALFSAGGRRPVLSGVVLAAMAQTHIFAAAVAGCFALALITEWWERRRSGAEPVAGLRPQLAMVAGGVALSFLQVWPPRGPDFELAWSAAARAGYSLRGVFLAFCPLPAMANTIAVPDLWNSNLLDGWYVVQGTLGLVLGLAGLVMLIHRPAAAVLYGSNLLCMLAFFAAYPRASQHHFGHVILVFFGALWIAPFCAPAQGAGMIKAVAERVETRFVGCILAMHVVAAAYLSIAELNAPFSGGRQAVEIIERTMPRNVPVVVDPDYAGLPIAGYLGRPVYNLARRELVTFVVEDGRRRRSRLPPEEMPALLQEFLNKVRQDIVVVVNYPVSIEPEVGSLLGIARPAIVTDEQYWVFKIRYGARLMP